MASSDLVAISRTLARKVDRLRFGPPVAYVYNPLRYAAGLHEAYLRRYGRGTKQVLLVGMNPGPFGMAQTGVPFGNVELVREWLGLGGKGGKGGSVGKPPREHPARPVRGLACPRLEVSGARLWGWARECFGTPERFFARFFVASYCPLAFIEESGRNRTPDKLPAAEAAPLYAACDEALRRTVAVLAPRHVIGIGAFATARARGALAEHDIAISTILHPSPASPLANRGWAEQVDRQLAAAGIAVG